MISWVAKMSEKPKPLRKADFPAPKKISALDFDELCETFKIPTFHRATTKTALDDLVIEFNAWMKGEKLQPDRASDRDRLKTALADTKKAAELISKLGPSGRRAFRVISASVAPMLAARWLNERFPDDDLAPQRTKLPAQGSRTAMRTPLRGPEYFIEEESIEARIRFVQHCSVETTIAALNEIMTGLERSIQSLNLQPGSRGGRTPLTYRRYLIINLAEIWYRNLGYEISTSANSPFAGFCEVIAVSIGWSAHGTSSDIPKAIRDWRNLSQKNHR
jgi:hypothetical protein